MLLSRVSEAEEREGARSEETNRCVCKESVSCFQYFIPSRNNRCNILVNLAEGQIRVIQNS